MVLCHDGITWDDCNSPAAFNLTVTQTGTSLDRLATPPVGVYTDGSHKPVLIGHKVYTYIYIYVCVCVCVCVCV
ncbi:hypothetical protein KIPB_014704, partial [Kipferlia bialata]|eukprot:g14704.t1